MEEMNTVQEPVVPPAEEPVVPELVEETPAAPLPANDVAVGTVGFGAYLGLAALFAVPVVGFIAAILFSFIPKRKSLKNYARATLTWLTIGLLVLALIFSLVVSVLNIAVKAVNENAGTQFKNIFDVVHTVNKVQQGDIRVLLPHISSLVGEEYGDFFEELGKEQYDDLITLVQDGDYAELLSRVENGEYDALMNTLDPDAKKELIKELKDAKKGNPSEWLQQLETLSNADISELAGYFMGSDFGSVTDMNAALQNAETYLSR